MTQHLFNRARRSTLSSGDLSRITTIFLTFSDPPEAKPKWVVADEIPIKINDEWSWLYDAIDLDTKLILGVDLFGRHGTDPAAAFLHGFSEAVFLVDGFGYQTALARLDSAVGVSIQTET